MPKVWTLAVILWVMAVLGLVVAACGEDVRDEEGRLVLPNQVEREVDGEGFTEQLIDLVDGRTVTCILYSPSLGKAGLSCDWIRGEYRPNARFDR